MPQSKIVWTITPEAFDSLLFSFDPDREFAGRVYENVRRKLVEFFEARGSNSPEEQVDETFDRVMRRMAEGEKIENPGRYCYGVAKFVWAEASRKRTKEPLEFEDQRYVSYSAENDDELCGKRETVERRLNCLEKCLDQLASETRDFIVEYYRDERGSKIEKRKMIAAELNTTINGLRLRASRLRRELGKCTETCIARDKP